MTKSQSEEEQQIQTENQEKLQQDLEQEQEKLNQEQEQEQTPTLLSSNSQKIKQKRQRGIITPAPFLLKLYEILHKPEYNQIVDWTEDGTSFIIINLYSFTEKVLPVYFRSKNFDSFLRQLNMYYFQHKHSLNNQRQFKHKYFLKNQKQLLVLIKRKSQHTSSVQSQKNDNNIANNCNAENSNLSSNNNNVNINNKQQKQTKKISKKQLQQQQLEKTLQQQQNNPILQNNILNNTAQQQLIGFGSNNKDYDILSQLLPLNITPTLSEQNQKINSKIEQDNPLLLDKNNQDLLQNININENQNILKNINFNINNQDNILTNNNFLNIGGNNIIQSQDIDFNILSNQQFGDIFNPANNLFSNNNSIKQEQNAQKDKLLNDPYLQQLFLQLKTINNQYHNLLNKKLKEQEQTVESINTDANTIISGNIWLQKKVLEYHKKLAISTKQQMQQKIMIEKQQKEIQQLKQNSLQQLQIQNPENCSENHIIDKSDNIENEDQGINNLDEELKESQIQINNVLEDTQETTNTEKQQIPNTLIQQNEKNQSHKNSTSSSNNIISNDNLNQSQEMEIENIDELQQNLGEYQYIIEKELFKPPNQSEKMIDTYNLYKKTQKKIQEEINTLNKSNEELDKCWDQYMVFQTNPQLFFNKLMINNNNNSNLDSINKQLLRNDTDKQEEIKVNNIGNNEFQIQNIFNTINQGNINKGFSETSVQSNSSNLESGNIIELPNSPQLQSSISQQGFKPVLLVNQSHNN